MAKLKDLKPDVKIKGIIPQQSVSVIDAKWHGFTTIELFYRRADWQSSTQLLYRGDEPNIYGLNQ